MENNIRLLSCPFCGSKASLIEHTEDDCVAILCRGPGCNAEMAYKHREYESKKFTENQAKLLIKYTIEKWNRRTA